MKNTHHCCPSIGKPGMTSMWRSSLSRAARFWALVAACFSCPVFGAVGPSGPTVTQGAASFNSQGAQLTINTSDRAVIRWQSFNIDRGQTTTFVQPSSSSVVWNQIYDPNPSQILGSLNANGYVILQNPSGIFLGGDAKVSAQGLVLSTAPLRAPDLTSPGAWQFNAAPPAAKIVNYGQINIGTGGSAYLIAHEVENHGSIQAPQGQIGLFAGQEVMISERPDGRGLSARVTLPAGSVDNAGRLVADGGSIALKAQVVNQGGLVEANSVRERNGVIEFVAGDSIKLGAASEVRAEGDKTGNSPGGEVRIQSGGAFSDERGSRISVAGGANGGSGGLVEVSARRFAGLHSRIEAGAASGSQGGALLIDPSEIVLSNTGESAPADGVVGPGYPPSDDTLNLNTDSLNTLISESGLSTIALEATSDIRLAKSWIIPESQNPGAKLTLKAGRNITFDSGAVLDAGRNWSVSLSAGSELTSAGDRQDGVDGIYLNGTSILRAQNGSISLWAANEVIVNPGSSFDRGSGPVGNNGIRTVGGGSIDVTALFGDVVTGGNFNGFLFGQRFAPYYRVSPNLGGISTAAGGDVTIRAGGNVSSYLPVQNDYNRAIFDGGTGAFGPQAGNVTIQAGGNVSGHYVLANGLGSITAGGDIGASTAAGGFALSLIKGSWDVVAPQGSIFLQDARNPNGLFNEQGGGVANSAGFHRFDYDSAASLTLRAGNAVEITGAGAPHALRSSPDTPVPFLFPPSLDITAGAGGITLDTDVILFPSPDRNLRLTTTDGGNLQSEPNPADPTDVHVRYLAMSDSGATQWDPVPADGVFGTFLLADHATAPSEAGHRNPVEVTVDGSMNDVVLRTTKATTLKVKKDVFNSGFLGQNLDGGDTTTIDVGGRIHYSPTYAFVPITQPIVGADPLTPSAWDAIFSFLVDPARTAAFEIPSGTTPSQLSAYADLLKVVFNESHAAVHGYDPTANPGFVYDPRTGQVGFRYRMSDAIRKALKGTLEVVQLDALGNPVVKPGDAALGQDPAKMYFATRTVTFLPPETIESLYLRSLDSTRDADHVSPGFQIGGPGQFNISAASIDLGSSSGIFSWGISAANNPVNYMSLAGLTPTGAGVKVTTRSGGVSMLTSTIASIYGGDVEVESAAGVTLSLGDFSLIPPNPTAVSYGIFTSGYSDVKVTADGDINVGGARIATFNGGDVTVSSLHGNVNAGNGANSTLVVPVVIRDAGGNLTSGAISGPKPFGSGILAMSPTDQWRAEGSAGVPGSITIETPYGNIISTLGGILQYALNGDLAPGPFIRLRAGSDATPTTPAFEGDVDLGNGGVVGGTIDIAAKGSIRGLIVSRQNSTIQAGQSFSGTLLSGGTASVSANAGSISGTVVGIGGVSVAASGGGPVTAALLGQNVSVGGTAAQSTLGTTAAVSATSQAAAQQSSTDAEKKVALANNSTDDEEKKKRTTGTPTLRRRSGRVTVILP